MITNSKKREMKINKPLSWLIMCIVVLTMSNSCTDDFAKINTNPDAINEPDLGFMFANIANGFRERYSEYYFEHWQFISRYNQHYVMTNGYDATFNRFNYFTERLDVFYYTLRNTRDIRAKIDAMPEAEKAARQKMYYTTFIPEVYWGLRNTMFYGAIPFKDAMKATEGKYSAPYDTQQELLTQWLANLDAAIAALQTTSTVAQVNFGNGDFIFKNDWKKWAQTANALKYRIASILVNKDPVWAKKLVQEVESSTAGLYSTNAPGDQLLFMPGPTFMGETADGAQNFWAAENFMNFLKANNDPRIRIFFRPNTFTAQNIDNMLAAGSEMPAILDIENDPLYRYQGAPVSPDDQNKQAFWGYYGYGNTKLEVVSRASQRMWNPNYENGAGYMVEPIITSAEMYLLKAEFIKRGFISGNAEEWYNKGVRASIETYRLIADRGQFQDYTTFPDADINAYLLKPDVKLDGSAKDLEKIILQQYINLFRSPAVNWDFIRRTGFPATNSTMLKYTPMTYGGTKLPVPRRSTIVKPSIQFMLDDWENAMTQQGFTPNGTTPDVLESQRLWVDTANPNYGEGLK
jgi:hypothetical protein